MSIEAEPVVTKRTSLGESAFWVEEENTLLWVDINERTIFIFDPSTGENRELKLEEMVGTVVPRRKGGIIAALQNGIYTVDFDSGNVDRIVDIESDRKDTRFNDGKCDPAGRLWAGTMSISRPKKTGTLYRIDPDHSVQPMIQNVSTSNGLLWTSDSRTMYYSDTPTRSIDAFDYDLDTGSISNRRSIITVPENYGGADGLAIDSDGNIWAAHYGGGCVRCWDTRIGKTIETVQVPGAKNVTSCSFGGPDLKTLYITTASQHMNDQELKDHPNSGFLFAADLKTQGTAFFNFGA